VSESEGGFERVYQGSQILALWRPDFVQHTSFSAAAAGAWNLFSLSPWAVVAPGSILFFREIPIPTADFPRSLILFCRPPAAAEFLVLRSHQFRLRRGQPFHFKMKSAA